MVVLAVGCSSTAAPGGRVDRVVVGNADTVEVYNRQPVQLPVHILGRAGRAVDTLQAHFVRLSGDSIPYSTTGIVVCLKPSLTVFGATVGSTVAQVPVRCRPVKSVLLATPIELVLGDPPRPLPAEILDLDGKPMSAVTGRVGISDSSVLRLEGGRLVPHSPGWSGLDFTVGDEYTYTSVFVYEVLATLDHLRPGQHNVALRANLRPGELRQWSLPAGQWGIKIRPGQNLAGRIGVHVEGAVCQGETLAPGGFGCLSNGGASLFVGNAATSPTPELHVEVLLSRS